MIELNAVLPQLVLGVFVALLCVGVASCMPSARASWPFQLALSAAVVPASLMSGAWWVAASYLAVLLLSKALRIPRLYYPTR